MKLGGLRVDDDVPAEQNAADDMPGMRGRIVRADGDGLGHTRTVEETSPGPVAGHAPDLQRFLRRSPGGGATARPRLRRDSPALTIPSSGADVDP